MELARILARHPGFALSLAISDKWAGSKLGDRLALPAPAAEVTCLSQAEGKKAFVRVPLVFLCTPHEVSIELAPLALAAGARVVDLSGGFRLAAAEYPGWYGFSHANPGLLERRSTHCPRRPVPPSVSLRPGWCPTPAAIRRCRRWPSASASGGAHRCHVDHHRCQERHHRRGPQGHRGNVLLRGRRRHPRLPDLAPPAYPGDRAHPGPGRAAPACGSCSPPICCPPGAASWRRFMPA